jgi:lysophospholipase L1-like esterase
MSLALKVALAPLLVAQAVATRRGAPVLPEAAGPRAGEVDRGGGGLRLLIAGDSSAAGVGVAHQEQARTGRSVQWTLHARSGLSTQAVHALLRAQAPAPADVAVVVSGVNDVIELVTARRAVQHREALADWLLAERGVTHVVFAPLPPVHRFPLLPQPLRHVMGADARRHDDALARWAATRGDVSHIAIEFALGPDAMASDGFHPGEPVYRACGEALAAHIATLDLEETTP